MLKSLQSAVSLFLIVTGSMAFAQNAELCAPFGVSVFGGDSETIITWAEPIGNVGCGDMGIPSLPFTDVNSNVGLSDDWDVSGSDGADFAYTLNVASPVVLTIDLCSASTDYDTKLEVFTADGACVATSTGYYDDDGPFGTCTESPAPYTPSLLENVSLSAGQYYIVVDGYGGAEGNYEITVTQTGRADHFDYKEAVAEEAEKIRSLGGGREEIDALWADARDHGVNPNPTRDIPPECGTFLRYNVYDAGTGTLIDTVSGGTTSYQHTGLTNGQEYCYFVTAVYSEGESANSDTACAIPAPFVPDPPTNAAVTIGDEELTLSWTDPSVPQLGVGYVETFENADLAALWTWEGERWSIADGVGNPGWGARFYWSPSVQTYDESMYSPMMPIGDTTDIIVTYDLFLSDFGSTGLEHLSVEIMVDTAWVILADYDNSTNLEWATYTHTVTGISGSTQLRLHAYGDDSFEINWWYVDNIGILPSTSREIGNSSIVATSDYLPGTTMDLNFHLNYASSDVEYLDGAYLVLPVGFTVNSATDIGGLLYNGLTGDTLFWGEWNDDGFGEQFADADFSVNVTIAGGTAGPQTAYWGLSGDTWGSDPHDTTGTLTINESTFNEYDFVGYNVYLDGVLQNTAPTNQTFWLFSNLTNLVTYELGVSAVHYPAYESDTVLVSAAPQYLFGDIAGYILDPNGDPLDSAVVTAGGLSDTTGADGYYFLWNLLPGTYTVKATRDGFEFTEDVAEVLASPDPTLVDLTLQPALARASGVIAMGGDHLVDLIWRLPGGETEYDLWYYDDIIEAQIGCGGGCEFGVRFTPPSYPAELLSLLITVQGDASVVDGNIIAYIDPAGAAAGPVGDFVTLATGLDLSSPDGSMTQYFVDLSGVGFVIPSGDAYIMIQENNSGFMGIGNDIDPQSPEFYDRNWVFAGGAYTTIFDAVGGDPTLTGDFGMLGTFFGAPGRSVTADAGGNEVTLPEIDLVATAQPGVFLVQSPDPVENRSVGSNPENVSLLTDPYVPTPAVETAREDSLVGFKVFQVTGLGDTLVTQTVGQDTTATILVPENYVEYCYNVKAVWQTDLYGVLDSKPSGEACTVPYTTGDADFDSDVDLSDLVAVVDFILEIATPTADQFRNTDVNMDGAINIADVVMIVDIIYGGSARMMAFDADALATLELAPIGTDAFRVNLDYSGMVRGLQFSLEYDADQMSLRSPQLVRAQDDVIVSVNESEKGVMNVVLINLGGGALDISSGSVLTIPLDFTGNGNKSSAKIALSNTVLAGPTGELIPVAVKSGTIDVAVMPGTFALHQNYPNPFNPVTEIRFDLPDVSNVTLTVYNLMGQKIHTLVSGELEAGFHSIIWNGTNAMGNPVSSGMYFYMIDAENFHDMKKMVLLK